MLNKLASVTYSTEGTDMLAHCVCDQNHNSYFTLTPAQIILLSGTPADQLLLDQQMTVQAQAQCPVAQVPKNPVKLKTSSNVDLATATAAVNAAKGK